MLLVILLIFAIPTAVFVIWLVGSFVLDFVREYRNPTPDTDPDHGTVDDEDAAAEDEGYVMSDQVAALGLLPPDRQNTKTSRPEQPEVVFVVEAARSGAWRPAAELMEKIGDDWERRSRCAYLLGEVAAVDDTWLREWDAERPDSADAAVVAGRGAVIRAWKFRGAKRAEHTTEEQFRDFHQVLLRARGINGRAAELNPADPTPYISEIWIGLGLGYPHEVMHALWEEITSRAPLHFEAHFSALQYWSAKWRGSHELAMGFATRAADNAPTGSLLSAMPLLAHYEYALHTGAPDSEDCTPEMIKRVDAALLDVAAADPDDVRVAEVRHLLAAFLTWQGRHEAALEQFRLVDGYVDAVPWRYSSDPAAEFCRVRDVAVEQAHATA